MKFDKRLYLGEKAKKKWRRTVFCLKHGKVQIGTYVIVVAQGEDLMEIYHSAVLNQEYYRRNPPFVIGIAKGYEEALEVVRDIVDEVYRLTGGFDLKAYIGNRQKKKE